jgi:hypothetical protein
VTPKQVARDDELLDLARAVKNAKCAGVPVKPLDGGSF